MANSSFTTQGLQGATGPAGSAGSAGATGAAGGTGATGPGGNNPSTTYTLFDDFLGGLFTTGNISDLGWSTGLTGDGNLALNNDTQAIGCLTLNAGNGSGNIFIALGGSTTTYDGDKWSFNGPRGNMTFTARVKYSVGVNFRFYFGIAQGSFASGRPDRGIWFELDSTQNANIRGITRNGSGVTATGSQAPDSNYHTLSFTVNSALNSVEFFYDGVSMGSTANNIPSANDSNGPFFRAEYNGSNGTALNVDYVKLEVTGLTR